MQHPPICCIWSSAKPPLDSENLENRQRQHGLCKEADGEGQRAQHRRNMPMAEIVGPDGYSGSASRLLHCNQGFKVSGKSVEYSPEFWIDNLCELAG
jgi:hypothetical protein